MTRIFLCATAVTQEWNSFRNNSQHRKLSLEKKILLPLLQGFDPVTFQSWVRHCNRWSIPTPRVWMLAVTFWSHADTTSRQKHGKKIPTGNIVKAVWRRNAYTSNNGTLWCVTMDHVLQRCQWQSAALTVKNLHSIITVIIDYFYVALFSALEQTHCALVDEIPNVSK